MRPDNARGGRPMPAALRSLTRLLLALYPPGFRREVRGDFVAAAEHRWHREVERGRGALGRAAAVLLADSARAIPEAWRDARRARRGRAPAYRLRGTSGSGLSGLRADLRLAFRGLGRRPGFSALVVVTLGLGIGASSAIVGVLDRFILRPLPFPAGERMAFLGLESVETGFVASPSQEILERWMDGARTIEGMAAFRDGTARIPSEGAPVQAPRRVVSGGLPALVGVRPVLGRALGPDDALPGAEPAVMLGEGYWRRAFGGDRSVLGRTVTFNDSTFTVVGVWPAAATLDFDEEPALWTVIPRGSEADPSSFTRVLAVLAPGVRSDEVRAELTALIAGVETGSSQEFVPTVLAPHFFLGDDFVAGLWVASAGVVLLLVVAVLNASNLLLNRAVTRGGEIGVRLALGGSGGSLVRLFVIEAFVLTLGGALLGVAVARFGGSALAAVAPGRFPDLAAPAVGGRAGLWALAAASVATALCGLVPALHLRSPEVRRLLEGRGVTGECRGGAARSALVTLQVALALVLAVGAGLGFRSLRALASVDPGFDLEQLAVVAVSLPSSRYPEPADRDAFMMRVDEALRALPGVEGVAISGVPPFSFSIMAGEPTLVGEPLPVVENTWTSQASASPGYFDVMGIPLLEGRPPTPEDARRGEDEPTLVLVNEVFARRFDGSVVGREMHSPQWDGTMRIIGVVGNVRGHGLSDDEARVQYYVVDRGPRGSYTRFLMRSPDPERVLAAARARIAELDPQLTPAAATTGREIFRSQTADQRFLAVMLGAFGSLALLVAMLGVYGSVALAVSRRTREIGVRVAMGAAASRIVTHVLRLGLWPVVRGAALGCAAALVAGRFVTAALYQVRPNDPLSFAAALVLLGAAATAACLVPARRALRVDPIATLRSE